MRYIDAHKINLRIPYRYEDDTGEVYVSLSNVNKAILQTPTEDVVERPPCKIGDIVYAVRNFGGTKKIIAGKVTEMYFTDDMRIAIGVKHIAKGFWGQRIFGSYEEAQAAASKGGYRNG